MTSLNSMVFFVEGGKYAKTERARDCTPLISALKYFYSFLLTYPEKTESLQKSHGISPIAES